MEDELQADKMQENKDATWFYGEVVVVIKLPHGDGSFLGSSIAYFEHQSELFTWIVILQAGFGGDFSHSK